jgi:hypothetical protein
MAFFSKTNAKIQFCICMYNSSTFGKKRQRNAVIGGSVEFRFFVSFFQLVKKEDDVRGRLMGVQLFASLASRLVQGCQMVYFQTKKPNLGKLWRT